ncbi:MAG: hypothetical protein ABIE22_04720 [archaeon]
MIKCKIQFVNEKVKKAFEKLDKSETSDQELKKFIERAFSDICENAFCGIQIPKRLIPETYLKKYRVKNLWKYNLPGAWRLLYSIESNQISVISIILEWVDHKEYEKRFNY